MRIWVDGDSCPVVIRDILYRAAERKKLNLVVVANRKIKIPRNTCIELRVVPSGVDAADNEIAQNIESGDVVITSDIPLASRVVAKGGLGLNPRGEKYTTENIRERLSARNFMDALRASGVETGGPASISQRDRQVFANALDQIVNSRT